MLYLTSAIALPGILLFATAVVGQADRFTIYDSATLPGYLGQACVDALTSSIKCNPYVQEFIQPGYHGSLESNELTDAVCTGSCVGSLSGWFATVSKACAGKSIDNDGTPAEKFGGYMWAGVNETCIKDPKTKKYCNGKYFALLHSREQLLTAQQRLSITSLRSTPIKRCLRKSCVIFATFDIWHRCRHLSTRSMTTTTKMN